MQDKIGTVDKMVHVVSKHELLFYPWLAVESSQHIIIRCVLYARSYGITVNEGGLYFL